MDQSFCILFIAVLVSPASCFGAFAVSIHVISAQPAAYVSQQRSNSLDLTGGLSDVLLGLTVVASRCGAEIEKYFIINDQNSQAR